LLVYFSIFIETDDHSSRAV